MVKAFGFIGFVLLAAVCMIGVLPTQDRADASCVPGRSPTATYNFAGWKKQPGGFVYGVRSLIENYDPYVGPNSFSSAWVMLNSTHPGYHYAQVGWDKVRVGSSYPQRRTFVQYWYVDTPYTYTWAPDPVGSWPKYEVTWYTDQYTSFFTFKKDNITLHIGPSDFSPQVAQVLGETNNLNNQMPGAVSNHVQMPGAIYTLDNGNYFFNTPRPAQPIPVSANDPHFGREVINGWQIDIWDKACQS